MQALGPQIKNSICFYCKNSSGMSGWLTKEDVLYLMDYILLYDTFYTEECKNSHRDGIEWFGLRLKASKKFMSKQVILLDGKRRLVSVPDIKEVNTTYHFKDKETRDAVRQYWTKE
jgi:hypothetical protein